MDPKTILRNVILATTLEPILEKDGCTTRSKDISERTTLEHFIIAGINSSFSFFELGDRIKKNNLKQPKVIFDLALNAQIESMKNRSGGKINWGIIMLLTPLITSQLIYGTERAYENTSTVLKQTSPEDVTELKKIWRFVKKVDGREMPPSTTFKKENVFQVYAEFPNSRKTEEIWHKEYTQGFPICQEIHNSIVNSVERGTKYLRSVENAYQQVLPRCGNIPGITADFIAAGMYTSLCTLKDIKII